MKRKKKKNRHKYFEKKQKQKYIKCTLIGLGVLVIIFVFSHLTTHPSMEITNISVENSTYSDVWEVEKIIHEQIEGKHFHIFSRANTFFVPDGRIERSIKEKFHSVFDARVTHEGLHHLTVELSEYEPLAVWCLGDVGENIVVSVETAEEGNVEQFTLPTAGESCFYMNDEAFIFAEQEENDVTEYVRYLGNIATNTDPIGNIYVEQEFFANVYQFIRLLADNLDMKIVDVTTDDGQTYVLVEERGQKLFIDIYDPVEDVLLNIQTLFLQEGINKAEFKNINYIDLRFGNRVYYKLK